MATLEMMPALDFFGMQRASNEWRREAALRGWRAVFSKLAKWIVDPSEIEDDDGNSPSKMTIRIAQQWAISLADTSEPPIAVVSNASDGITFEWRSGVESHWIKIYPSGEAEDIVLRNHKTVSRHPITLKYA